MVMGFSENPYDTLETLLESIDSDNNIVIACMTVLSSRDEVASLWNTL